MSVFATVLQASGAFQPPPPPPSSSPEKRWYAMPDATWSYQSYLSQPNAVHTQPITLGSLEALKLQEYVLTHEPHQVAFVVECGWHRTEKGREAYHSCLQQASKLLLQYNSYVHCGTDGFDCGCDYHSERARREFAAMNKH